MSNVIQLLPDHVANQIAAGEVVQRPASVVKELLENAVDAGATQIQLIVKEAGRAKVQVIDNGKGMSVTDARMAFERHATSKIHTTEDIFKIQTKGFRGEALASIAAIAQVELKTRQAEDEVGTCIHMHGGEIKSQEVTVTQVGTSISVKNLFYNVPARRNFLKSNTVEFRHILDEFHRVALAHEDIHFTLIHNDEEVFRLIPTHLAQRILHVFGKKLEGQLVSIEEETDIVKISGFVAKPEVAKKSRGEQFFFVNHRFIKSGYLHKALLDAFENLIPKGYHPSYFIFLEMNPEKIDINIHPTKTEIKFDDDYAVYAQLRAATKHALGQYQITPTLDFDKDDDWEIPTLKKGVEIPSPKIQVDSNYNPFEVSTPPSFSAKSGTKKPFSPEPKRRGGTYEYYELEQTEEKQQVIEIESRLHRSYSILQYQNAYLVVEYEKELLLIDQHRAHQSILFDGFKQRLNKNTLSQQLLFPIDIPVNSKEISWLNEAEKTLFHFGFDYEIQDDVCTVKAIPAEINTDMVAGIFEDFFSDEHDKDQQNYAEVFAKLMAKSAAIKKGTKMSQEEAEHIVHQFFELEQWVYSPFGKKNFKSVSLLDLQKQLD